MGLFKPAWQSKDVEKAVNAVVRETNQSKLIEIAKQATPNAVRKAAVEKITDLSVLLDIAKTDSYWAVTQAAEKRQIALIEMLTDQAQLAQLVKTGSEWYIRKAAMKNLTDQSLLADIAQNSTDRERRRDAEDKLKYFNNSMVFQVLTMSVSVPEAQKQLWAYFDEKQKNNGAFKQMLSSFSGAEKVSVLLNNHDVLNEPVRWLASATNNSIDTVQTLSGVRLFMLKGKFDYQFSPVEYSACYYFSKQEG